MSIAATRLTEYRTKYSDSRLDAYEHRLSNYGIYQWFKDNTSMLLPANMIAEAKKAQTRATKVPVIDTKDYTITTSRSLTIADSENTSSLVNLVFATLRAAFTMYPAQYLVGLPVLCLQSGR